MGNSKALSVSSADVDVTEEVGIEQLCGFLPLESSAPKELSIEELCQLLPPEEGDLNDSWAVIGIDTEYTSLDKDSLHLLSYQFYLITPEGRSTLGIRYTNSAKRRDRLKLEDFILDALEQAFQGGLINRYPSMVYIVTFFARADLLHFNEAFKDLKTVVKSTRRTIASLSSGDTYGISLQGTLSRHVSAASLSVFDSDLFENRRVNLRFYDAMLMAPNGRSLDDLGQMLGVEKLSIPEPYRIEHMDEFLKGDKKAFEDYALRDAEIVARYFMWFKEFFEEQGVKKVPVSIGSAAVSLFRNQYIKDFSKEQLDRCFNLKEESVEYWPKEDGRGRSLSPVTKKQLIPEPGYGDFEQFAINAYHGGYNISFEMGVLPLSIYNDFDISSAYTTALNSVRPLDFNNLSFTKDPNDFKGDVLGLARVAFKFPDTCRYPCLPVRSDRFGLINPLQGEAYAMAHEIALALEMGCELKISYGLIVPWQSDHCIFSSFMSDVRGQRNNHEKGSLHERLWKELGNSLYGKTAQGLRAKTGFDAETGLSKTISKSSITHAFIAAYVTGVVRALLHELIQSIPAERTVISATTDGFLTDATLDEIALDGSVAKLFTAWYKEMDPSATSILELKHGAQQIVAMKTRGQLTSVAHPDPAIEPVIAKASVRVPSDVSDASAYMLDLYLNREPGQLVDASHLISTREQFTQRSDLIMVEKKQRLSLEFDFKRDLVNPVMREANGYMHLACSTVPFKTEAEQRSTRILFDRWRRDNCLKTVDNFNHWQEYRLMVAMVKSLATLGKGSLRLQRGDTLAKVYARLFCRGYMQGYWGFPPEGDKRPVKHTDLSNIFDSVGIAIKTGAISQSKNRPVVEGMVLYSPLLLPLIRELLKLFPDFDFEALLREEDRPLLRAALIGE